MSPAGIVVSGVEDMGRARHLVKRLRAVCPETPIVVGCWGSPGSAKHRADLCAAGADEVVTTLGQARSDLLRLMPAPRPAAEDDELSTPGEDIELATSTRSVS